jgi:hypothetical protein
MSNPLRCERREDAEAIAKALDSVYPSYRCEAYKPKGARRWRVRVYCRASGALLLTSWEPA